MPSPSIVVIVVALVHHRQAQAGVDPPPFDDHRAGAALAVVAALLGAGQVQMLAQRIEQRRARIELKRMLVAIDGQRDLGVHGGLRGIWCHRLVGNGGGSRRQGHRDRGRAGEQHLAACQLEPFIGLVHIDLLALGGTRGLVDTIWRGHAKECAAGSWMDVKSKPGGAPMRSPPFKSTCLAMSRRIGPELLTSNRAGLR